MGASASLHPVPIGCGSDTTFLTEVLVMVAKGGGSGALLGALVGALLGALVGAVPFWAPLPDHPDPEEEGTEPQSWDQ